MAVENMIETRLKEPKSITYNKGAAFEKYVLADAFDNLIFYATDYHVDYLYAFKCKNTEEDINEVREKIKGITYESPCYGGLNVLVFPESVDSSFYKFEGENYYNYSVLNYELERIQRKIDFLNYDNSLEKSLESILKDVKFSFEMHSWDKKQEMKKLREQIEKINFLNDFKFLILSKNENIKNLYKIYLDGIAEFYAFDCQYEESLHR